jgi:TldD protein
MIAKPTYLIRKGVVNRPITELYSASGGKFPRSANARAESFDHKIYARMSNTYFDKGKYSLSEMMSKMKEGMFLHYSSGGMEDPKGWGVQIQGIVAERIKDGKLTGEMFYEVGMTGYLPDMLSNIKMVGKDVEIPGAGRCGKGHKEWVRVSEGGPHMLVEDVNLS